MTPYLYSLEMSMNPKFKRSDFIILGIYLLFSVTLMAIDYVEEEKILREYIINIPLRLFTIIGVVYIFIIILLPVVVKDNNYLIFIIFGSSTLIAFLSFEYFVQYWSKYMDWPDIEQPVLFLAHRLEVGSYVVSFPLAILLFKKYYEGQTDFLEIQRSQKENELKLLRTQLDPHFLFNNLNTLDAIIETEPQKAKEYISRLSSIYRYLIQTKDSEIMELEKELEFVKSYIYMIETRFGQDYTFYVKEHNCIKNKFLPTGALQALIENVVKHNKAQRNEIIETTIEIQKEKIIIKNSKSVQSVQVPSSKTGLANLNARYQWLSKKEIKIKDNQQYFEVIIPLLELNDAS